MRHSRMIGAAAFGGILSVLVAGSAGIGQSPRPSASRQADLPQLGPQPMPRSGGGVPATAGGAFEGAAGRSSAITPMAVAGGMLGFASPDGAGGQVVTLVDSRRSWMAVYAVDDRGQIRLLSSRPLEEDFSVQFNVTDPTPAEIGRLKSR